MTLTIGEREALATALAKHCIRDGDEMILLSGSTGTGSADSNSDLDLYIFADRPTSPVTPIDSLSRLGLRKLFIVPTKRGGTLERCMLREMVVDVEIVPRAALHRTLNAVLDTYDTDPEKQKIIRGVLDAKALFGVGEWRHYCDRLAIYPRQLGTNMVRAHLRFEPMLPLKRRTLDRDDPVAFFSRLTSMMINILGVLAGLNGYYLGTAPGIVKWTDHHLKRMQLCPSAAGERMKAVLRGPSNGNLREFETLVKDVLDLIDRASPVTPTCNVRHFLGL